MAKWDHADLLSVDAKAILYPEYTDLESLKRYNPEWLLTEEGRKHWPNYVPRPYGGREEVSHGKIDIPKAVPWWADKVFEEHKLARETPNKWDKDFLDLAEFWANKKSKDPSTKCCCVIVRPDKTIASMGYNGFPRGIEDKPELYDNREEKYKRVIHAEMNAILTAREPLHGYTLYTHPGPCSCERCTVHIIQAGIKRVVAANKSEDYSRRYYDQTKLSEQLYKEAGVEYEVII